MGINSVGKAVENLENWKIGRCAVDVSYRPSCLMAPSQLTVATKPRPAFLPILGTSAIVPVRLHLESCLVLPVSSFLSPTPTSSTSGIYIAILLICIIISTSRLHLSQHPFSRRSSCLELHPLPVPSSATPYLYSFWACRLFSKPPRPTPNPPNPQIYPPRLTCSRLWQNSSDLARFGTVWYGLATSVNLESLSLAPSPLRAKDTLMTRPESTEQYYSLLRRAEG